MSDDPFIIPPVPLMTPDRARDVGRAYKALADQLNEAGLARQAAVALRDSNWWLTYAITLAQTAPGGSKEAPS
jgi:hypothetical protein